MPPEAKRKWSKARVDTFYNWMKNGYPRGVAEPKAIVELGHSSMSRVRKNLTELSPAEIEKLKQAFCGLIKQDPDDSQSYFSLAGIHWLPGPNYYCRHHENAYNPWHRLYLIKFEDALRSVEGCEDVTLPYWDITDKEVPSVLYEEPFANYTIPQELCPLTGKCYPEGYVTQRFLPEQIIKKISEYKIPSNITNPLGDSHWERFNGWDAGLTQDGIIRAHDSGHNACGETMRNQDIAAFDPIFWFFHANWDRLWWKWQQTFEATTLSKFKTHLSGSADWLDDPVLNQLPPFQQTSAETIDLSSFDINYIHPATENQITLMHSQFGSIKASHRFELSAPGKVSVRVKNIDRLQIPGSFDVCLHVGDKIIAKQGFFQSTTPQHCKTCKKNALVSFDFVVDQSELLDGKVYVTIHLLREEGVGGIFPLSTCGDPTVNIRLLLEE